MNSQIKNLPIILLIMFILMMSSFPPTLSSNYPVAKPNCTDRCGSISIPFPFGTTQDCYRNYCFFVTCNQTVDPPKLFLQDTDIEITDISLAGQLTVLPYIARACYAPNGTRYGHDAMIKFADFTVNNTANKFTIVGCDAYAFISGQRLTGADYETGCMALCKHEEDLVNGSCNGVGCCQLADIPKDIWSVEIKMGSFANYTNFSGFDNCRYAFLAKESAFSFSSQSVADLKDVESLPMVADWAIGNMTCEEAKNNSSAYACKSLNSKCYEPTPSNGSGYRCSFLEGYQGNPYLVDGCQDIDECELGKCRHDCRNTNGSFTCLCPKGYHGDGENCSPRVSLIVIHVAGFASGITILLLAASWWYLALKRRSFNKMKQKFFLQNGGTLLQDKLHAKGRSPESVKIFTSFELKKATNDFNNSMIVGQGGFGTVAIKKSKRVDPNQVEQFINEVIVLSQINHRNVVRLLGCCLETEVPLLVYEFISNGKLFLHTYIIKHGRAFFLGIYV